LRVFEGGEEEDSTSGSKHYIEKYDILLDPQTEGPLAECLDDAKLAEEVMHSKADIGANIVSVLRSNPVNNTDLICLIESPEGKRKVCFFWMLVELYQFPDERLSEASLSDGNGSSVTLYFDCLRKAETTLIEDVRALLSGDLFSDFETFMHKYGESKFWRSWRF
jgi:hypothetical protein